MEIDILPGGEVPQGDETALWPWVVGGVLAVGIGVGGYFWYKKKKQDTPETTATETPAPKNQSASQQKAETPIEKKNTQTTQVATQTAKIPDFPFEATVVGDKVNVREKPTTKSNLYKTLSKGAKVKVVGEEPKGESYQNSTRWFQIEGNKFVHASLLTNFVANSSANNQVGPFLNSSLNPLQYPLQNLQPTTQQQVKTANEPYRSPNVVMVEKFFSTYFGKKDKVNVDDLMFQ